jgi:hypothetical protein
MRNTKLRQAMLESLENRRLLAGNVTAALVGGTLVITGDNKANDFQVIAGFSDTTVVGLNGTRINGNGPAVFGGFPDLRIDTGNGDDKVDLIDIYGFGGQDANVATGNGQDTVIIRALAIDSSIGTLNIDTGNGDDLVDISNTTLGDANIRLGNGDDTLKLSGDIVFVGTVVADGGHGNDTLDQSGVTSFSGTPGTPLNFETFI